MARKSQDLRRVEARDSELAAQQEQLERELEFIRLQRQKIQTTKQVLEELAGAAPAPPPGEEFDMGQNDENEEEEEEGAQEEALTGMTIADMAIGVLLASPEKALTSTEILDAIRETYMPSLLRSSLSPPLSRLKKKGIIDLVGDQWTIIAGNGGTK